MLLPYAFSNPIVMVFNVFVGQPGHAAVAPLTGSVDINMEISVGPPWFGI